MEYISIILSVSLIHLLAVISPGPDLIVAINNSILYSRKTGIYTAIGFGLGITIHISYSIFGLAIIISQSTFLFNTIKLLGASYLIYIGYKSITATASKLNIKSEHKSDISAFMAIKIGFLTNVLNPKATLFFLSLFTIVISPDIPKNILFIISLIMIINTILWFSLVAFLLTQQKIRNKFYKIQAKLDKILGIILILIGIKIFIA